MKASPSLVRTILLLLGLVVVVAIQHLRDLDEEARRPADRTTAGEHTATGVRGAAGVQDAAGDEAIADAFARRRSDLWVESTGTVESLLSDDRRGSHHQRFVVRLKIGQTLLIAHNIDLAPRVPIREGDRVGFRGEYEWNDRGGIIHWTHDDPQGSHAGGWIQHEGQTYR
jgi:hypothetical protein